MNAHSTTALDELRTLAARWRENADQTRAGADESLGWQIDRMGERDDIAHELVTAWQNLDNIMTRVPGYHRPDQWCVPPLTDEQR
ncbi:hypothetical protein, partial [Streptomyces sp. bgisy060]|uniref:hypothetical protein n=1 Tax=Streptomyces sp. bgisy060 TaxID=3413775 RepID=UPI003EB723AB